MPPTVQQFRAQLHRARLSSDDFAEAADYLAVISTAADDVHRRALLTAAVVAYARPFTNNSSGVEVNATPQLSVRLSKLFSQQEQQLHDELLALRNEVVAHTEYKRKPVKRIQGSATGFSMTVKIFDIVSVPLDMYLWSGMCGALRGHCFQAMMELNSKIVDLNP